MNQKSKDKGGGSLEWAAVGRSSGENDGEVEEKTDCRGIDDNTCDNFVDEEEVIGEGVTEEEWEGLEHEG